MNRLIGREIHLASRPKGWPTTENFQMVEVPVAAPGSGQLLIRNMFLSVDPYMRVRMDRVESYAPPFEVGQVLDGFAVGEVVASETPAFVPGDVVQHRLGWREYAVLDAEKARKVYPDLVPSVSVYLGVLGPPGLTAYIGLLDIAQMRPDDVVFVSAGAGAVGSVAGQIARLRGASRVVASVGSDDKVKFVTEELGFDAAFNYRRESPADGLARVAPDGIDVYFDNVGGDHLDAALASMRPYGRVAMCGAVAQYNAEELLPGPRNMPFAVAKRLMLRGFLVRDHGERMGEFITDMAGWLLEERIRYRETIVEGIEQAPEAFLGMLRGDNVGKMLVRLDTR